MSLVGLMKTQEYITRLKNIFLILVARIVCFSLDGLKNSPTRRETMGSHVRRRRLVGGAREYEGGVDDLRDIEERESMSRDHEERESMSR